MTTELSNDNIIKLGAAETSREIKKHLKKMFPHMEKLSVTCKNFSLRIKWLNGPSLNAVKEVTKIFEGATLVQNGGDMIKGYNEPVEYAGKKIEFGIDYIFCDRELSPANEDILAKYVEDKYGKESRYAFEQRVYNLKQELDASDIAGLVWMPVEASVQVEAVPAIEAPQEVPSTPELIAGQTVLLTAGSHKGETATYLYTQKTHPTAHVQLHTPEEDESGMYCCPLSILRIADEQPDPEQEKQERQEQAAQLALGIYEALLEQEQEKAIPETIETEDVQLDSPEVEQVVDPRSNPDADVFYRFDKVSRMHWLEFPGKPDEATRKLLGKEGWRFSSYRVQWYTNRKWAQVPAGIDYCNAGYCDYAAERADRLEERADKAATKGQQHYQRVRSIADMIPFGQPILVGHHSEKRARKDAERIDTGMRNYIQEANKAERLEGKAESSRTHQAYLESAGVISRRVQRLEADLRAYHRNRKGWGDSQEWQRRVTLLEQEIAENKAKLEALGGIKADHLNVEKGDIIKIDGSIARVDTTPRKGGKTYTYTIIEGGARGMQLTTDRSRLQAIVKKHNEVQVS